MLFSFSIRICGSRVSPGYNGSPGSNGFFNDLSYFLSACCIIINALCGDDSYFLFLLSLCAKEANNGAAQAKNCRLMIWTSVIEAQNYFPVCSNVARHIFMNFHTLVPKAKSVFLYSLIDVSEKSVLIASTKTGAQRVNNT